MRPAPTPALTSKHRQICGDVFAFGRYPAAGRHDPFGTGGARQTSAAVRGRRRPPRAHAAARGEPDRRHRCDRRASVGLSTDCPGRQTGRVMMTMENSGTEAGGGGDEVGCFQFHAGWTNCKPT